MWLPLLGKELKALLRDGRAAVLAVTSALLFAGAGWAGLAQSQRDEFERQWVQDATRKQWDTQGDKHPHRGAHFGLYALRPVSPLAWLDPGVTRSVGQALYLEPHRRNVPRFANAADDPAPSRLAELTPAFMLQTLLPLLAFVLAFASVSAERESGTLRMLLTTGRSPWSWVCAKVVAVWLAVAVVVLAGFTPVFLAVGTMRGGEGLRLLLLVMSALAATLVYASLAVAVSAWVRSSRVALLSLLALWAAVTLLMPRIGAEVAERRLPSPGAAQFWAGIARDYRDGLPGESDLATQLKQFEARVLLEHGVSRTEDLKIGYAALRRLVRDAHADRVHSVHFERLWNGYDQQRVLLLAASGFSPAVAWRGVSMAMAGTDLAHERHFQESAERYRQAVNTAIDRWDARHSAGVSSYDDRYAGDELWTSVRQFSYQRPTLGFAASAAWREASILLAWLAVSFGLLVAATRRLRA